jgi:hypothetical protein
MPEKGVESLLLYCQILGWHEADRFVDRAKDGSEAVGQWQRSRCIDVSSYWWQTRQMLD